MALPHWGEEERRGHSKPLEAQLGFMFTSGAQHSSGIQKVLNTC